MNVQSVFAFVELNFTASLRWRSGQGIVFGRGTEHLRHTHHDFFLYYPDRLLVVIGGYFK